MQPVVPPNCLQHLPFLAEAVSSWKRDGDLESFLVALYDMEASAETNDGQKHTFNYSYYGNYLFEHGHPAMLQLADELTESSHRTYHQDEDRRNLPPHLFRDDPSFGLVAKSYVAWGGMTGALLSENCFASIYHTLEAETDLECSISLVKTYYYKQASYCLRAYIENVVVPVHFVHAPDDYKLWKKGEFKFRPLRGKEGLLSQMVRNGYLTADLAARVEAIYAKLNAYVHSGAAQMIHAGHESKNWRGLSFKVDAFHTWSALFTESVEAGLRLTQLQAKQWQQVLLTKPDLCTICHSEGPYTKVEEPWGTGVTYRYTCTVCGHKIHRSE